MRSRTPLFLALALLAGLGLAQVATDRPGPTGALVNILTGVVPAPRVDPRDSITVRVDFTLVSQRPDNLGAKRLTQTENAAPWCFRGDDGKTCHPWDTTEIEDGTYKLFARGWRQDGTSYLLGPTWYAIANTPKLEPEPAYTVNPGDSITTAIAAAEPGATITVAPGVYREKVLIAAGKHRLHLVGAPGAIIKGSDVWDGWTREGAFWTRPYGIAFPRGGQCASWSNGRCQLADQVFVDGLPQYQELAIASVGPGEFAVVNGRLYLGSDPTGRTVEVTTRDAWLVPAGVSDSVTITGFTMMHAGNRAQTGALRDTPPSCGNGHARCASSGWVVHDNDLSSAHGVNLKLDGDRARATGNRITRAGQLGAGGSNGATGQVWEGNEIALNHTEAFETAWEAGGTKWAKATDLVLRNNRVHANSGPGLWCDIDCERVLIENNKVFGNGWYAIVVEISLSCTIRNNLAWENGWYRDGLDRPTHTRGWAWGAGIAVQNTRDCLVEHNTVAWNADGISVIQQDRGRSDSREPRTSVTGVVVRDNLIATQGATPDSMVLAWVSDAQALPDGNLCRAGTGNAGSSNRYHRLAGADGRLPYWEWCTPKRSLESMNGTPGGQGGTEIDTAALAAELTRLGIPLAPQPR